MQEFGGVEQEVGMLVRPADTQNHMFRGFQAAEWMICFNNPVQARQST